MHGSFVGRFQEIGLDEVERLGRRPRTNVKERLVHVLLELVTSCKSVTACSKFAKKFVECSLFLFVCLFFQRCVTFFLIVFKKTVQTVLKPACSVSSQQSGCTQERLHQEEFGEALFFFNRNVC